MSFIVRKIHSENDLTKSLEICAKAFSAKCPLFLLDKIPASDFISYYTSIKKAIFLSPFTYSLSVENEIKAALVSIPSNFIYEHKTPPSMQYYDNFFSTKFEENKKFFDINKTNYALFLGSEWSGAGKIIFTHLFEDMKKLGFKYMYCEMSNPINTKTLKKFNLEGNLKMELIREDLYRDKIKVDFLLTSI